MQQTCRELYHYLKPTVPLFYFNHNQFEAVQAISQLLQAQDVDGVSKFEIEIIQLQTQAKVGQSELTTLLILGMTVLL